MDIKGRVVLMTAKALGLFANVWEKIFPPDPRTNLILAQPPRDKDTLLADMRETLDLLKELGVEVTAEPEVGTIKHPVEGEPEWICVKVDLPYDNESDHSYILYYYSHGERHIYAKPIDKETGKAEECTFWFSIFEYWDYDVPGELIPDFHAKLKLIVENESRITQQDMGQFWDFTCEVLSGGEWVRLPGVGLPGKDSGAKFPEIDGLAKLYYSKPLASKRK
jgi:hypothetical protein